MDIYESRKEIPCGEGFCQLMEICFYGIKWFFLYWDYVASSGERM
jgi:hypothetical protein